MTACEWARKDQERLYKDVAIQQPLASIKTKLLISLSQTKRRDPFSYFAHISPHKRKNYSE